MLKKILAMHFERLEGVLLVLLSTMNQKVNLTDNFAMLQDLKGMIKDLLKSFYRSSSLKPKRLIFYRDGVSEGQFAEVQRFEITQVSACFQQSQKCQEFLPILFTS